MRHANLKAAPELQASRRRVAAAESAHRRVVRAVQAKCSHPVVLERPGSDGWLGYSLPRRICPACGYEEEAWHWPTHAVSDCPGNTNPGGKSVLNTDLVVRVTERKFFACRP